MLHFRNKIFHTFVYDVAKKKRSFQITLFMRFYLIIKNPSSVSKINIKLLTSDGKKLNIYIYTR